MPELFTLTNLATGIVGASCIWVFLDAERIGVRKPALWLVSCLVLWPVAFPIYLFARRNHARA